MKHRYRVLFLSNIPSPYMIGYLNELGKYCSLTAVFEKEADRTRPESWKREASKAVNFHIVILKGISIGAKLYGDHMGYAPDDKALSPGVVRYILRGYDLVISANPCTPTGILAILYMRLYKIPYAIQSEGGFPGDGAGLKERLKCFLMKKAVLYFSTCRLDDRYFYTYGAVPDKIRRYIFTSLYAKDIPRTVLSQEEKRKIKKKLGISSGLMILTAGRSVPVKGFDILIKAFQGIEKGCSLYLAGAEELREYQEIIRREGIEHITFLPNTAFDQLKQYYLAADIFVLPTRGDTWGLVINEAMAYGLPVITTDRCVAGDALIENGRNGFIVKADHVDQMRNAMKKLVSDPDLRRNMAEANCRKLQNYTLEEMGRIVYEHIREYSKA